jgi:hypothetical protein
MATAQNPLSGLFSSIPFLNSGGGKAASASDARKHILLEIRKGRETLQSHKIQVGDYLIGSSLESDILIIDDKPNDWFDLIVSKKLNGFAAMLLPLVQGLVINGKTFQPSESYNGPLPIEIKKNDLTLVLRDPKQPRHMPAKLRNQSMGIVPMLAMGMGGIFLLYAMISPFLVPSAPVVEPVIIEEPSKPAVPDAMSEFKQYVDDMLSAAGINPTLESRILGNKLRISGTLSQDQATLLESIISRADPAQTRIETRVRPIPSEMPQDSFVAGVELQPEKYVIDPRGRRVSIGEEISNGWIVEEINDDSILLERGVLSIEISL